MKVSGFTFIRNAIRNDFPIVQAINSILPLCDEFIVAAGDSDDGTRALIEAIGSPKIKIIDTVWDNSLREGGKVLAQETDKALAAISPDSDWAFYIQGDEAVHESDHATIREEMEAALNNPNIEGLLFKYMHFYGSYDYYGNSRRWYRREIRLMKNIKGIHSYRDAQGFRLDDRKLKVKLIDAHVYHYGWAKPPEGLNNKMRNFSQFYHDDTWRAEHIPENYEFDYSNADKLSLFTGTHPAPMQQWIRTNNWQIDFSTKKLRKGMTFRRKFLQFVEELTGWRIGEYENYKIVER